jgi:hypothetical protein
MAHGGMTQLAKEHSSVGDFSSSGWRAEMNLVTEAIGMSIRSTIRYTRSIRYVDVC